MRRREFLSSVVMGGGVLATPACALLFSGPKKRYERGHLQVGFLLLDILLAVGVVAVSVNGFLVTMPLGVVALIVDFATGAMWTSDYHGGSLRRTRDFEDTGGDPGGRDRMDPEQVPLGVCPDLSKLTSGVRRRREVIRLFSEHVASCPCCAAAVARAVAEQEHIALEPDTAVVFRDAKIVAEVRQVLDA